MQTAASYETKRQAYISSTNLVILAFASAFFPRVLMMVKFPSLVNFLHFAIVPLAFAVAISKARSTDRQQIAVSKKILFALFLLLSVGFASAFINDAGIINVILHFLLFAEPFMLLLAIICIPMSPETLTRFRAFVVGFGFVNLTFALIQKFVLKWDTCFCSPGGWGDGDAIKGVFINQGSGHVVSASISASLAAYFFFAASNRPLWLRALVLAAAFIHILVSDAKQVILVAGAAFALLSLFNMKDVRKAILYTILFILAVYGFSWAVGQFEFLSAYLTWARPELYGPDGEATQFKLSGISIVSSHMKSPFNWWFGLGPGHTIDRLGGWMLKDYASLLTPLGATSTTIANEVWRFMGQSWLANGSSMFAPFFGWAAIWGDLGVIGLGAYLYLAWLIWHDLCLDDDISKWQMLTVFVNGLIFTQMQEPGYMLFIAALVGLRWHEKTAKNRQSISRDEAFVEAV
ncbi:hypothetical protein HJG54_33085 [Leptolyngbya sp. NK1-12]|uniref:O-antigen ligase domain-containing protein n=1 Tax=Leptolyngbya sp. NK1-12 TaxID=2547451 RepID=A0AA96WM75_9CYAN|nr:hypothetical protein [Leptolyngbya sp. NK1-12]WNZ27684.1 hypothetical protein HJG54_33085 [Leptolyngbya sp. NK1-12]